jgi:hypothetical protein
LIKKRDYNDAPAAAFPRGCIGASPQALYRLRSISGRHHVKRLLIAAAALAFAPGAVFAADLSGAWTVHGVFDSMGVKYDSPCKLAQDSTGKLAGSCLGNAGDNAATTGMVTTGADGKTIAVEFAYDTTYQGTPVHLDYKGTMQADGSLAGTVDTGGPQGTFTATK